MAGLAGGAVLTVRVVCNATLRLPRGANLVRHFDGEIDAEELLDALKESARRSECEIELEET